MKTGIKVLDAMTNRPVIASSDNTVTDCAKMMNKFQVGSLLIKDNKEIVGILTEKDFVTKIVAKGVNPDDTLARDVMEKQLITITPEKDIYDAMILMKDSDIRRLPVKEKDKIIGFLTMKDILKIEPQLFDLMIEKIDIREANTKPINVDVSYEEGMCESCGNFSYRLRDTKGLKVCPNCSS